MTRSATPSWDAVVIGAGPAGATAARRLARSGVKTLLLEQRLMPRYKACGGGVPARTMELLDDVDVSAVSEGAVYAIEVSRFGRRAFRKHSRAPLALMVMRDRFDQLLADAAADAGAVVRDGMPVQAITQGDEYYELETPVGALRVRYVLAADGAVGPTARWLGIASARTRSAAYEVEVAAPSTVLDHWQGAANVDIGYRPWGYGWVFPKAGVLSVGVVMAPKHGRSIRRQTDRYLDRLGLADAQVIGVQGHPIRYRRHRGEPVASGRALLLGDAAGLADEFTAEGIAYAAHSARLAADSLLSDGDPASTYTHAINREIQPELDAARTISKLYYWCVTTWPWLALTVSNQIDYLWRAFFRVMRGESTYEAELSRLPGGGMAQRLIAAS